MDQLANVTDYLQELMEDNTIPKNVKTKISNVIKLFGEDGDENIKINKALDEFDEIATDNNIQPYTRTQIWNVVSMLENID